MNLRVATFLTLPLLLAGCSFHYGLKAVERNGNIAFEPADDQGTGCLANLRVTTEAGAVMWELDAGYFPPPCKSQFPVAYGIVPPGMTESVKAVPLRRGVRYDVKAWDGDGYSGTFRLHGGDLENLEASS
jgi:hypothetical protein